MKIRNGFVSNSSSASFVVLWSDRGRTLKNPLDAIVRLLDLYYFVGIETDKIQPKDREEIEESLSSYEDNTAIDLKCIEKLIENTTVFKDGTAETSFFTHMHNTHRDFGLSFLVFMTQLSASYRKFDIINRELEKYS